MYINLVIGIRFYKSKKGFSCRCEAAAIVNHIKVSPHIQIGDVKINFVRRIDYITYQ